MPTAKPIQQDYIDPMDQNGRVLTLCIIHEMGSSEQSRQAMYFVGGMAICSKHITQVGMYFKSGATTADILQKAAKDFFD